MNKSNNDTNINNKVCPACGCDETEVNHCHCNCHNQKPQNKEESTKKACQCGNDCNCGDSCQCENETEEQNDCCQGACGCCNTEETDEMEETDGCCGGHCGCNH